MTVESFESQAGPDRFATYDEIRAALSSLSDCFLECQKTALWEVASDRGGYVLIESEKEETLTLLETLDTAAN
ncbi:MAG TPA: hypothetical protein VGP19_13630 [Candidatus Acidoferrales bacterium]|jgi:hypothetical protein|nr:hypothetical protein [Candidatus Acidoferrales bacterium]